MTNLLFDTVHGLIFMHESVSLADLISLKIGIIISKIFFTFFSSRYYDVIVFFIRLFRSKHLWRIQDDNLQKKNRPIEEDSGKACYVMILVTIFWLKTHPILYVHFFSFKKTLSWSFSPSFHFPSLNSHMLKTVTVPFAKQETFCVLDDADFNINAKTWMS